jgi:hypothetical protein
MLSSQRRSRRSAFAPVLASGFLFACGGVAEAGAPGAGSCAPAAGASSTLASGPPYGNVNSLAVDETSVYLSNGSGIVSVSKCGGGTPVTLASVPATFLAVDETRVYWTTGTGAHGALQVMSVPKQGGAPTTLASVDSGWPGAGGIAVDDTYAYWTNTVGTAPGGVGAVMRTPKAGGSSVTLAAGQNLPTVIPLSGPSVGPSLPMAIDDARVYWMDTQGALKSVPKPGGAIVTLAPPLKANGTWGIQAIAVDDARVYSVYFDGTVTSVPKAGGASLILNPGKQGRPAEVSGATGGGIAFDGTAVYWATGATRTVASVPKVGGPVSTLATNLNCGALALDGASLYWVAVGAVPAGMGPGAAYTRGTLTRTAK